MITSSTPFNAVVLYCDCKSGEFQRHWVQVGTTQAADGDDTSLVRIPAFLNPTNSEIAEIISRIKAGTAHAFYYDGGSNPEVFVRVDQAPQEFWQFHGRHPFWKEDGFKMLDRLATRGNLVEDANSRHYEFQGGFTPQRTPAASTEIQHSLSNWSVSRGEDDRFVFRLIIPSSANVQPSDLGTYPDAIAFIKWLDQFRSEGNAIPDAFATTSGAFSGRKWRPPFDPDNATLRRITLDFQTLSMGRVPGANNVITLTLVFGFEVDSGYTADSISTNDFAAVVNAASGTILGAGQTIEPPFGASDITTLGSRLESNDGSVVMAGGIVLVQWKDPGSKVQRTMPLSGFGRSESYDVLPVRSAGGKWAPRPEEKPRVDLIHFEGSEGNGSIWIEPADRFVGYAGTDRKITFHNRSAGALLTIGFEKVFGTPITILVLKPGERLSVRVSLELNGASQYYVDEAPFRYLVRGGGEFRLSANDFHHTINGGAFEFVPLFPGAGHTQRREADEYTFGADPVHAAGSALSSGLGNSPLITTVKHDGDFIFYQQAEIELLGSGQINAGHSFALVRERAGTVDILSRFWHPTLSGIGTNRGYTTAYIGESNAGDKYVAGIIFTTAGTTVDFDEVRVNAVSQIMRVSPRILV